MIPTPIFFVRGHPQTQGNHRVARRGGFSRIYDANAELEPWRDAVAKTAAANGWGRELIDGPVALALAFIVARPRSHFGKRGLRPSAPVMPDTTDDMDKLVRAIGDSLAGIVYTNDSRIVATRAVKLYGTVEGVMVTVTPIVGLKAGDADLHVSDTFDIGPLARAATSYWQSVEFETAWRAARKVEPRTGAAIGGAA